MCNQWNALFFKSFPDKVFTFKGRKCYVEKQSILNRKWNKK